MTDEKRRPGALWCGPGHFDTPHRGEALRIVWKANRSVIWRCAAHWAPTLQTILSRGMKYG